MAVDNHHRREGPIIGYFKELIKESLGLIRKAAYKFFYSKLVWQIMRIIVLIVICATLPYIFWLPQVMYKHKLFMSELLSAEPLIKKIGFGLLIGAAIILWIVFTIGWIKLFFSARENRMDITKTNQKSNKRRKGSAGYDRGQ